MGAPMQMIQASVKQSPGAHGMGPVQTTQNSNCQKKWLFSSMMKVLSVRVLKLLRQINVIRLMRAILPAAGMNSLMYARL